MEQGISYDRPREKLQKKGVAALTNAELLQILIGSGTAQASVTRIARKVLKQLTKHGNNISYDLLLEVIGLGPARASLIMAAFELASRYPMSSKQLTIDTAEKARGLMVELTLSHTPRLVYLTVDGAKRLIAKRSVKLGDSVHPSELLRGIFSNAVTDQAAGIMVAIGYANHSLDPSMFELSLARDLNGMAQLFIITIHDLLLVNKTSDRSPPERVMVNGEKIMTRQLIIKWFERAQIDYSDLFVKEYIAYNAWFRKVTDCHEDHEAIKEVSKRFVIWDDYLHGRTLTALEPIAEQIANLTQRIPVRPMGTAWNGTVKDKYDWRGLIYFWYQTRCDLFHGLTEPGHRLHDTQIKLAYESLNIFMSEIIKRMRYCFTDADYARLAEVRKLLQSEAGAVSELRVVESHLHVKFIHSPDLWNVDMERV